MSARRDDPARAMAVTDPVGAGLAAPKQTAITDLLDEALSLWRSDPVAARACIVRARALTGSTGSDGDGASSPVGVGAPLTWRARQIAEFVDANIGRIIYSAELAGAAKMSTGQLARALKATFGVSPSEYVMHRRLALAQRLMLETNDALAQIAEVCGLCDQAHLSRAFRKTFGQTPAAWRREHRGLGRPLSVQPQAFADQLPDGPGTAL